MSDFRLTAFIRESNLIEGIERDPTAEELAAATEFMGEFELNIPVLNRLQRVFAPNKQIRDQTGLDVRVGDYIAPPGGPNIRRRLEAILGRANLGDDPWSVHVAYETLHPYMDGNGRTGRMIWAWQMHGLERNPFTLPFLHRFYYQTLENQPNRR
jgi:hypothetical protein